MIKFCQVSKTAPTFLEVLVNTTANSKTNKMHPTVFTNVGLLSYQQLSKAI